MWLCVSIPIVLATISATRESIVSAARLRGVATLPLPLPS